MRQIGIVVWATVLILGGLYSQHQRRLWRAEWEKKPVMEQFLEVQEPKW